MKLIEKTCPNCGANIDINKNDEKVTCDYCKKTYLVEKDPNIDLDLNINPEDAVKLVASTAIGNTIIGIAVFLFIVVLFVGIGIFAASKNNIKTTSTYEESKIILNIDAIPEDIKTKISSQSITTIRVHDKGTMYERKEEFKNLGMYLLVFNDDTNAIYDVYKSRYVVKGEETDIYFAVYYTNVKDKSTMLVGILEDNNDVKSDTFMLGYKTIEELYKAITGTIKPDKVYSTNNLYIG